MVALILARTVASSSYAGWLPVLAKDFTFGKERHVGWLGLCCFALLDKGS